MTATRRAFRFFVVGAGGAALQLLVLAALVNGLGVHYGAATATALGATLAHNFFWHARWTWRERRPAAGYPLAFARFVSGNGGVSIVGAAVLMPLGVEWFGLPAVAANAVTIAACGLVNFWLASRVFRRSGSSSPVVAELQLDAEVTSSKQADGVLQFVLRRR